MEVHGSRSEIIARMRQARTEKLHAKLAQEGIGGLEPLTEHPVVTRFDYKEDYASPQNELPYRRERSSSQAKLTNPRSVSAKRVQESKANTNYSSFNFERGRLEEEARMYNVSPSKYNSLPQEKFYENAKDTIKRKQLVDSLVKEEIKSKANSKKMNKKSEQILREKLEENLTTALLSVCPTEESLLNFERLGRVLFLMSVFNFIRYDENCEVVIDLDIRDKADQLQRYEEVVSFLTGDDVS
jgi:hypothetical protein